MNPLPTLICWLLGHAWCLDGTVRNPRSTFVCYSCRRCLKLAQTEVRST